MKFMGTILALKNQIHEKKEQIKIHDHPLGWNDETRAREYRELNVFYDAYFALLEAYELIDDSKKVQTK